MFPTNSCIHISLISKMEKRTYGYFICLLILCFNIQSGLALQVTDSQKAESPRYIQQITFHGNKAIDAKAITAISNIRPKQVFDPSLIDNGLYKVLNEYKKLGYFFAKATWEYIQAGSDTVILKVDIDEGEQIRMGKIELLGNVVFPMDQLLSKFDIRKGRYFNDAIFGSDIARLLRFYSDNGHPMASVSPDDFDIENGELNLKVQIDAGPIVKIGNLQIEGLKKTKERTILRELPIHPGDTYNQQKIDETERSLNNIGYFRSVSPISFSQAENGVDMNISVMEGPTGRFNGLLGYNPSESESGKLVGVLEASEMNLLGTGRQVSFISRFGLTDTYELTYQEPWIFGTPVDLGVRFQATTRSDTLTQQNVTEREAGLSGTVRMIEFVEGTLGLTYKRIKSSVLADAGNNETDLPSSVEIANGIDTYNKFPFIPLWERWDLISSAPVIKSENPQPLSNGRKYGITLTLKRDSRDYFANPVKGRLDRIGLEVSRGDFKIFKAWLDLNQYFKIYSQQVLAFGFHAGRAWGNDIPLTELFYLGGANTLRGYNEDMFRGEGRLYTNVEYRFLVGRNSQFFLFLDGGSIYSKSDGLSSLKLGYGFGMRLESMNGIISMDYGLAEGDSVLKGKIHVSLGAVF